jgi:serine phosphatase RsbU (regulator of sigma subunit)
MILLLIDFDENKIKIARAGHNPMIYIDKNSEVKILKNKGIGLGLDRNNIFVTNIEESEYNIEDMKFMFLYTDGLVESMNNDKQEFGLERVLEIIKRKYKSSTDEIIKHFDNELIDFRDKALQNDDITFLAVKFQYS